MKQYELNIKVHVIRYCIEIINGNSFVTLVIDKKKIVVTISVTMLLRKNSSILLKALVSKLLLKPPNFKTSRASRSLAYDQAQSIICNSPLSHDCHPKVAI